MAAVLLLIIFWGINNGKVLAQAAVVESTGKSVSSALQLFYQDQGRFPSALEFSQQNVMLNYLTSFPLPEFVSQTCSQTFVYKRVSNSEFALSFCLPTATSGYNKGWNTLKGLPQAGN